MKVTFVTQYLLLILWSWSSQPQASSSLSSILFAAAIQEECLQSTRDANSCEFDSLSSAKILRNGNLESLDESNFQKIYNLTHAPNEEEESKSTPSVSVAKIKGGELLNLRYVKNFLTPTEVTKLIEICNDREGWTSSPQNLGGTASVKRATRTSQSCPIIWPLLYLPKLESLKQSGRLTPALESEIQFAWLLFQRIASLLNVDESRIEPLQLIRYSPGQFYRQHHDHGSYYGASTEQRPITLLLFLSTVPLEDGGGHTKFNELDVAILPRAGDGIIWNNIADKDINLMGKDGKKVTLKKGGLLMDAVHEAVPPKNDGEVTKYAMNVWIAEKSIMMGMDSSAYRTT